MSVITHPHARELTKSVRATVLVFNDPRSRELLERIERLAPSEANALVIGETGTGKELVARHIHLRPLRLCLLGLRRGGFRFSDYAKHAPLFILAGYRYDGAGFVLGDNNLARGLRQGGAGQALGGLRRRLVLDQGQQALG